MIDIRDPSHSALATFFGVTQPVAVRQQASVGLQFADLLRLLIDDAAAMCPSTAHLQSWRDAGKTAAPRDFSSST